MELFDLPQAEHFCSSGPAPAPGTVQSLNQFHRGLRHVARMTEGSTNFEVHRVNVLYSAQRWLVFAIANYRRAVEMLIPVSSPWAHVTLYYASFYAAHAVLGMFGGWVGYSAGRNQTVDVESGRVGSQVLRITRGARSPNGARGSHQVFWDFFYDGCAKLVAWTPAKLAGALNPVNSDFAWQIHRRNEVNYDMHEAWTEAESFWRTFKAGKVKSLSGHVALQLDATEQIVKLGQYFADQLQLDGAGLQNCGASGGVRRQLQRALVSKRAPNVIRETFVQEFLKL